MQGVELVCPYCTGRFGVEPAVTSRAATCPHCGRPVTVPATPPAPPPPAVTPSPAPPPPPPPAALPPARPTIRAEDVREGEAPVEDRPRRAEPAAGSHAGSAGASPSPVDSPSPVEEKQSPVEPTSPYVVREPAQITVNRQGDAVPLRRLAPEERQRHRRRMNLVFAVGGLVVLAIALAVLLHVRP